MSKPLFLTLIAMTGCMAVAEPVACWQLQDKPSPTGLVRGAVCKTAVNSPALDAETVIIPQLAKASFTDDTPGKIIIAEGKVINGSNTAALTVTSGCHAPVLTVKDNPLLHGKDFTVEFFAKFKSALAWSSIIAKNRDKNRRSWSLGLENKTGLLMARMDTNPEGSKDLTGFNSVIKTKAGMLDEKWHHVAMVYDGLAQTLTLYVDYRDVGSRKIALDPAYDGKPLEIMGGVTGIIDEIRITNAPLAPAEFMKVQK